MSLVERASDFFGDAPAAALAPETVYDLLREERRRVLIHRLVAAGEPVAYSALVDELAAHETDTPPAALDADDRKRVYVSLYQSHIPRLADADVVAVHERGDERVIEPGPNLAGLAAIDERVHQQLTEPEA